MQWQKCIVRFVSWNHIIDTDHVWRQYKHTEIAQSVELEALGDRFRPAMRAQRRAGWLKYIQTAISEHVCAYLPKIHTHTIRIWIDISCMCLKTIIQICTQICTRFHRVHFQYAGCIWHMHHVISVSISIYLLVSQFPRLCILCICVSMLDTLTPHICRHIHIYPKRGSSYLYVSDCICPMNTSRYAFSFFNTCTYARLQPVHI